MKNDQALLLRFRVRQCNKQPQLKFDNRQVRYKEQNIYYKLPILDGLELLDAREYTHHFPFHKHNTFNITLVREQIFSTKLTDGFWQAPVGAIVVTNPGEVHATFCDTQTGSSFFTFYVSPAVLEMFNKECPVFFETKIIADDYLFRGLHGIFRKYTSGACDIEDELLLFLQRLVARYAAAGSYGNKEKRLFHRFLEDFPPEKFSLEKTASAFGLDKYKFLRLFKQETGLTPNNYVILQRIEKCKELLKSQHDLLDIAVQTGFYDATHLCRHFKRVTGITPLAYHNA